MSYANRSPSITTITLSITTLVTTYLLTKSISKYGVSGAIRYIWEGDHLSPEVRYEMDQLESLEKQMRIQKKKMNKIGFVIETAKLNSVDEIVHDFDWNGEVEDTNTDGYENDQLHKRHYILSQIPSLSKDLGMLSYNLDNMAAKVDSVQSHGDDSIKAQKKGLSHKLVEMMGICDEYMRECGVEAS